MRITSLILLVALTSLAGACSAVVSPDTSRLYTDGGTNPPDTGPPMACGEPGALETVACGNCGAMERFCSGSGFWENGPCTGQGICAPGTTDDVACGNCGTRASRCTATCTFEALGECTGEGECAAGTRTRSASGCAPGENRAVVCNDACTFVPEGACMSDECPSPGALEQVACGNCGTQDRFCSATGVWEYGPCGGEGVCAPGTTDTMACGMCGARSARCTAACVWDALGVCEGEGECVAGATRRSSTGCPAGQTRLERCDDGCTYVAASGCTGSVGTGHYLDRCVSGADCASGRCVDDVGGTRMCTRACVAHGDCASEHVCAAGFCAPDDTGAPCLTGSASSCALGLCAVSVIGAGHCTRGCASALDCPAGYACTMSGSSRVCVDIERPCSGPAQCITGTCLPRGCSASCRSAADCPRRLASLPAYTCAVTAGSSGTVCVPPSDVLGSDPIGASCSATGDVFCRSGACDGGAPGGAICTQACTQEGGCGPGFGCWPELADATITLFCSRAAALAIGSACTASAQCDSGLCDASGVCTRLCTDDALCPTAMICEAVPGLGVSFCR